MEIRLMRQEDYELVYRLWNSTPGMGLRNLDDSPEGIARFLACNPATSFVAEDNGKIVGVILSGHDGRRGYIYHAAVSPAQQRNGIGSALVNAVINAMKGEGIHKLALVVFKDNAPGNEFWASQGFVERDDLVYRNRSINEENR